MKNLIISKYNQLSILIIITVLSGALLMLRIKLTQSLYLLFLVWNAFLAFIPYAISFIGRLYPTLSTKKGIRILLLIIWILFLPNAPYILSDFTHLRWTSPQFLLIDTLIITSFSLLGLLYMYYSVRDMQQLYFSTLSRKQNLLLLIGLCILLGFGIYLGRYLRWNSWDLIQNPERLLNDISALITHPIRNKFAWFITLAYATISGVTINILNRLKWTH